MFQIFRPRAKYSLCECFRKQKSQHETTMNKHTLFYSTKCRFCQAFLEELMATPFAAEFKFFCVDPSPTRGALPQWLKSVPSVIIVGESEPRIGPGPVNNWLFERKLGSGGPPKAPQKALEERSAPLSLPTYSPDIVPRPDASSRTPAPNRNENLPPAISSNTPGNPTMGPAMVNTDGPMAYHGSEMGSGKWSDNYSFVGGDEFASDKGYNPIERAFGSLVPMDEVGAGGVPKKQIAAPQPKRSQKEEALLNEFQSYSAARDKDIPSPYTRQ